VPKCGPTLSESASFSCSVRVNDMIDRLKTMLGRRELFRTLAAGTAVAAVSSVPFAVLGKSTTTSKKPQRARYQPDSQEVQTFYRVNRYPQK
jgi:hypothetical protein